MKKIIINALLYNMGWYTCVTGGNTLSVIAATLIITIHLSFIADNNKEWFLIILVTAVGVSVDSFWFYLGILENPDKSLMIPLWLVMLWATFATTLNHCLRWFKEKLLVAAIAGSIAGPFFYYLGSRLSDVSMTEPLISSMLLIAVSWSIVLPLLFIIAQKLEPQPCSLNSH